MAARCPAGVASSAKLQLVEHDAAGQAEAVGVQAGGGQAEHDVAGLHGGAVDDPLALHDADGEARQVVLARRVESGQLGRLAADQRAAGLPAALGHAPDDGLHAGRGRAARWPM